MSLQQCLGGALPPLGLKAQDTETFATSLKHESEPHWPLETSNFTGRQGHATAKHQTLASGFALSTRGGAHSDAQEVSKASFLTLKWHQKER